MEKLIRAITKNLYAIIATASFLFVCTWLYQRTIKRMLHRYKVSRFIKKIQQDEKMAGIN